MIRTLRRRHHALFLGLAALLPALYAAALLSRPPLSLVDRLPEPLGLDGPPAAPPVASLALGDSVTVDLLATDPPTLSLHLGDGRQAPDQLLYLSPEPGGTDGGLPPGSVLLGPATRNGARLRLPGRVLEHSHLLLYSLGHQQVIARSQLPPVPSSEEE